MTSLIVRFDDWLHAVKYRNRRHQRRYKILWRTCLPVCWLRSKLRDKH